MKWSLVCTLFIAAISIALLAAAPGAGKAPDAQQKFDLADLADGESRAFGEGDHAITATRRGNDVELTFRDDDGKSRKQTLHCTLGKDNCYVMTRGEKGEGQVVVLSKKAASGKDGAEMITKVVLAGDPGEEQKVMVFSSDDGEGGNQVVVHSGDSGMTWVTAEETTDPAAGPDGNHQDIKVIRIVAEGGTVLRCPEGDATLTLKKGEEKSGPYFCPRHNLKMEPSKEPVVIKEKVKVEKKPGTEDKEY